MADPNVRIIINAVDNASRELDGIVGSFTEFNSMLGVAEKGLDYLQKAFDATVGETVKYAEEVRDLSRVTGLSADESSRLIQVADDLKVELGTLKLAAKQLAEDGMTPNIDTLAQLSDQYLAFQTDTERNSWAVEKFGRNYQEMTKILEAGGKALREGAAGVGGGFLMSEEDLQTAREYEILMDNLGDALMNIQLIAGKAVLNFIKQLQIDLQTLKEAVQWFAGLKTDTQKAQAEAIRNLDVAARQLTVTYGLLGIERARAIPQNADLTGSIEEQTAGMEALVRAQFEYEQYAGAAYDATGAMNEALEWSSTVLNNAAVEQELLGRETQLTNERLYDEIEAAKGAANALASDLVQAYANLGKAQQDWNTTVGEDAARSLKGMELSAVETAKGLGAIDSVFGTNTLAREQYATKLETINAEFAKTGDVDEYKKSLGLLADEFEDTLAKDIGVAQEAVDNLKKALNLLAVTPDIHIPVYIDVIKTGPPIPGDTGTGTGGNTGGTGGPINTYPDFMKPGIIINNYTAAAARANWALVQMMQRERINTRMGV